MVISLLSWLEYPLIDTLIRSKIVSQVLWSRKIINRNPRVYLHVCKYMYTHIYTVIYIHTYIYICIERKIKDWASEWKWGGVAGEVERNNSREKEKEHESGRKKKQSKAETNIPKEKKSQYQREKARATETKRQNKPFPIELPVHPGRFAGWIHCCAPVGPTFDCLEFSPAIFLEFVMLRWLIQFVVLRWCTWFAVIILCNKNSSSLSSPLCRHKLPHTDDVSQ